MAQPIHIKQLANQIASKRFRPARNNSWLSNFIVKRKAKIYARKIMRSLNEAEEINNGRRKGKSFDDFLSEL
jgi:hypothetical protein